MAVSAPQSRAADSVRVSRTVCRSNADRLMTLRTSAVAVCCCSASLSSSVRRCNSCNNRAFSIAISFSTVMSPVEPAKRMARPCSFRDANPCCRAQCHVPSEWPYRYSTSRRALLFLSAYEWNYDIRASHPGGSAAANPLPYSNPPAADPVRHRGGASST